MDYRNKCGNDNFESCRSFHTPTISLTGQQWTYSGNPWFDGSGVIRIDHACTTMDCRNKCGNDSEVKLFCGQPPTPSSLHHQPSKSRTVKITFPPSTEHPCTTTLPSSNTPSTHFLRPRMKFKITERLPLVSLIQSQHHIWSGILPNHTNGFRNIFSDKRVNEPVSCIAIVSRL